MAREHLEAARRAVAVLRSMRGIGGKVAQVADLVDEAWLPPEAADVLADLRAGAPEPVAFKRIERELRAAWGGRVASRLAAIEPEPAAMASAGQVHRAELAGTQRTSSAGTGGSGRAVAVKVLHPGAEEAVRADLGSIAVLAQLAGAFVPGLDARAVTAELRERLLEEFDLELEAQAQRSFWRAYRGHPFAHVPAPVTDLCRPTVLVSEWLADGVPVEDPDRYGEALVRFHVGALLSGRPFHADPHPGNHRLLPDGRLAFVDFGAVGRGSPAWLAPLLDHFGAHPAEPEQLADLTLDLDAFPAGDLQAGRMVGGLVAVLARLRATVPWAAIAAEYGRGAEPATELGRAEAGFWARR